MATLELQFNCLCLFVPEPAAEVVHVLMPGTGHAGHEGHEKHVVRMLHGSFAGNAKEKGLDMEGWALTLGPEDASADLTLLPLPGALKGGELPNLSDISGKKVNPALVGLNPGKKVAARITLRSGRVTRMSSEATWVIGSHPYALAHQVTWQMSDVGQTLRWEGLNGKPDSDPKPLTSLNQLQPEDDLGYKLRIFHVTEDALPPTKGVLKPEVMRAHYSMFYPLLGEDAPGDGLLPRIKDPGVVEVNCGAGRAKLG